MTDTIVPCDLLTGLPSRRKIAELILSDTPSRDTFAGWQHFRATRGLLVPAPGSRLPSGARCRCGGATTTTPTGR